MSITSEGLVLTPGDLSDSDLPRSVREGNLIRFPSRTRPAPRQDSLLSLLSKAPMALPRLVCEKVDCVRTRDAGHVLCDRCEREKKSAIRSAKIQKTKQRKARERRKYSALLQTVMAATMRAYRQGTLR